MLIYVFFSVYLCCDLDLADQFDAMVDVLDYVATEKDKSLK